MKTLTIKINDKEVIIKKLALGRYAEVLGALDKLPEKLGGFDALTPEKVMAALPKMISESFPELVQIVSIASGIPENELAEEYGLDDTTILLKGIFEVNDFNLVKKNIRGLFQKQEVVEVKTGSKK